MNMGTWQRINDDCPQLACCSLRVSLALEPSDSRFGSITQRFSSPNQYWWDFDSLLRIGSLELLLFADN